MPLPTLSVITPSFNSGEFIEDAILSVYGQRGVQVEHLVVDGGSTDGTIDVLQRHPQVLWTCEKDGGQSDAINKGFQRASGELMGWLNADDYYLPGGLAAIAKAAQDYPGADVIYGDCVFVNSQGRIVRSKVEHTFDSAILLYFGCYIPSTSTFVRRRVVESGLLLDRGYRVCMDFEYFARLAHRGCKFHYVPQFIAAFRWHGSNISLSQTSRRAEERLQVQHCFGVHPYPQPILNILADVHRAKRLLRKLVSGNMRREVGLRRMMGRQTLWTQETDGLETCAKLACL